MVFESKIVEALIGIKIDDAKKVLNKALPGRVKDANKVTASWRPERKSGIKTPN